MERELKKVVGVSLIPAPISHIYLTEIVCQTRTRLAAGALLQDQRWPCFSNERERDLVRETRLLLCFRILLHQLLKGALHRGPVNGKRERETRFQCPRISKTGQRTPVEFEASLQEGLIADNYNTTCFHILVDPNNLPFI